MSAFAEQSFGVFQEGVEDIVLRVRPAAAARAKAYLFHPTQVLEPQPDGGLIVRMTAGGLLELCWHLFTWRGEIEVVGPERLKAVMAEELARFGGANSASTHDQS